MKPGTRWKGKKRWRELWWKFHNPAQSFVLRSCTMHELLTCNQNVSIGLRLSQKWTTIIVSVLRKKKANKNMKPRILQIWQPFPCEISDGTSRGNSLMVCALCFAGSSCYGFRPGELFVMCSCAKHFTFAVRLSTKDYKLVPATC